MKVHELKEGDILTRISDGSEWEFQKYVMGKITLNPKESKEGRSGIVENLVMVKPLNPRENRPQDLEFLGMQANEFSFARSK